MNVARSTWIFGSCLAAFSLWTCKDGTEVAKSTGTVAASSGTDEPDEDLGSLEPVPMGLTDGTFLAFQAGLAPYTSGNYETLGKAAQSRAGTGASQAIVDTSSAAAVQAAGAPGAAAGELGRFIRTLDALFEELFADDGLIGKRVDVRVDPATKKGATVKLITSSGSTASYSHAVIRVNGPSAPYRYSVELYTPQDPGMLERRTVIDFTPKDDGSGAPRNVHVVHQPLLENGGRQYIDAVYDPVAKTMTASYGLSPVAPALPAKTKLSLNLDQASSTLDVRGAYVWKTGRVLEAGVVSLRYADLVDGDVELFQAYSRGGEAAQAVQKIAFIPVERRAAIGLAPTGTVFATDGHATYALDFVTDIVRMRSVNPNCAMTGRELADALAPAPFPASAEGIPDDICRDTPASDATDGKVQSLIVALCAANTEIELDVLLADGTPFKYQLCKQRYRDIVLLTNPQYLRNDAATKTRQFLPESAADAIHADLRARFTDSETVLDLTELSTFDYPAPAIVAVGDLGS